MVLSGSATYGKFETCDAGAHALGARACDRFPIASHGHSGQTDCSGLTLAEWLCRTADRIDPARVFGPHHCLGRGTSAPDSNFLCRLLQLRQNASVVAQGWDDFSSDSTDRNHSFTPNPRRASPSLRPDLSFRYTQLFDTYGTSSYAPPRQAIVAFNRSQGNAGKSR